jgi:hypothetical protein
MVVATEARKNGRRRARNGHGEARADRNRCRDPVAWRFGRAHFKPMQLFSKATRVLVTAMEKAQVKRLICVTGFGAGDSRGHGGCLYNAAVHLLLGRVYDDKDVQERIVRRSKLDWVIVRPVILTDGPIDERLSRVGRSTRLEMRVYLARRRGGFPRQTDRR